MTFQVETRQFFTFSQDKRYTMPTPTEEELRAFGQIIEASEEEIEKAMEVAEDDYWNEEMPYAQLQLR